MDMTAKSSPSPPSSCPTSGGTPTTPPQHAYQNDFLHEQCPHELTGAVSSKNSAIVPANDVEQQRSTLDSSFGSSRSQPSSSDIQHQSGSPPLFSQPDLSEGYPSKNTEVSIVPPEQASMKSRSRARELSAPLPSVPPSTPASAVSHRSSFSTHANNPSISPSFLRHGSPIFSSPLTELSDTEEAEQDVAELSDSNSIEIISGYVAQPFVPGRYRSPCNELQSVSQSSRSSYSSAPSPPDASPGSNTKSTIMNQGSIDLPVAARTDLSASETLALSQSPPSTHTTGEGATSFIPIPSRSKQTTSSQALSLLQARSQSHISSQLSCSVSLPTIEVNSHQPQGTIEANLIQEHSDVLRTPNVYINGLPPHFPDESLYLMTRDFGHVLSVRTFTRCVGEKMSGYGFVLFDSIESAGRCIETLRKYRNLHPSYSKQVHKIPGTPYASGTITLPPVGSLPSLTSQSTMSTMSSLSSVPSSLASSTSLSNLQSPVKRYGHQNGASVSTTSGSDFSGKDFKELTFREKMERLKDEKSTNLYMEGLPLTIDEMSLAALMSPHKIVSSRFFQTKLSNPPRMIAFVRLETRAGSEEVIERLHGRVVRGWNDNGCRISVRFADTHEQRELRRSERLNRGEEEVFDNSQLSMAHAALLNLRGAEIQTQLGHIKPHHQRSAHHGHRFPVNTTSQYLADVPHPASDLGRKGSHFHASEAQDVLRGYGAHPTIQHAVPQYHYAPAPTRHAPSISSVQGTAPMGFLDGKAGLVGVPAMLKQNPMLNSYQPFSGVMTNSLSTAHSDLPHQRNQLQQLHLLRQLQKASIDTGCAIEHNDLDEAFSLMPSVDITMNQFSELELRVRTDEASVHDGTQRQQDQAASYGAGMISDVTQTMSPIGERYLGGHHTNDQVDVHQDQGQQHRRGTKQNAISVQFTSRDTEHREGILNSSSRRTALDEGEVTLISPALTYASRTPSTLSPATPLFNTFATPAAAPATVPRGKTNMREREYARLYKNELRQASPLY